MDRQASLNAAGAQRLVPACVRERRRCRDRARGTTLVELVVTLAVMVILIGTGVPSLANWIRIAGVRTTAEAISSGLQLARTEAIRRNRPIEFRLTGLPKGGWRVGCAVVVDTGTAGVEDPGDCLASIMARSSTDMGSTADVSTRAGSIATFSPLGRVTANRDGSAVLTQIDVTDNDVPTSERRALRLNIAPGGDIRLCDPAVASSSPRAC